MSSRSCELKSDLILDATKLFFNVMFTNIIHAIICTTAPFSSVNKFVWSYTHNKNIPSPTFSLARGTHAYFKTFIGIFKK